MRKFGPAEGGMNEKHEGGGAYSLREDCACLVIEIIICNHLPPASKSKGCSTPGDNPQTEGTRTFKGALRKKRWPELLVPLLVSG